MARMIFVNLPVTDLKVSMKFYEAIGATNNARFTDETAACMVFSGTIYVMLLTHEKWATFNRKPIVDARESSEVMLCISCENRAQVDEMAQVAIDAGGTGDVNPVEDHGFMYSRDFADPDGHIWEPMWIDMAAASVENEVAMDA